MKNVTLESLIEVANANYANNWDKSDLVLNYHRTPDENHGDTLAKFIAIELKDTFDSDLDDHEKLHQASLALSRAGRELERLAEKFDELAEDTL